MGRHLGAASFIHPEVVERKALGGFDNEVNEVVFSHPIPKVGRKKHRSVTRNIDELGYHSSV